MMLKTIKTGWHRMVGVAAVLALLAAVLPGCQRSPAESRSIIMAAPPASTAVVPPAPLSEPEPEVLEDEPMELSTVARSVANSYAGNANGCYTLLAHPDSSADVVYIDYAALTMSLLDSPPKEKDFLQGRLAAINSSATPLWAGDHLFVFNQRSSDEMVAEFGEDACASIIRLNADGASPAKCVFAPELTIRQSSAALWDGRSLFFLMEDRSGEKPVDVLYQLDIEDMAQKELHRFDPDFEYSIEGYWEKGPVVCEAGRLPPTGDPKFNEAWDNRGYKLFRLGMLSGERTDVMDWTQGLANHAENDKFYFYSAEEDVLYELDVNTGEKRSIAEGLAPQREYIMAQILPVMLDGLVRMQFSADQGRTIYNHAINPQTGEVNQPPVDRLGENISVLAEGPEFFLVRNGDKWVRRELIDPDYDPNANPGANYDEKFVSVSEYGLISKADYWAGNARFTPIADNVYDKK